MKRFIAWTLNNNETNQNIDKNLLLTCTKNGIIKLETLVGHLLKQKTIVFHDNYVVFDDNDKLEFFLGNKELPKWIYPIIIPIIIKN